MAPEPLSPSASSALLPFLGSHSRRGSLASLTSRREIDRDALAQALDHIHTSASKSETLTSFHDFDGSTSRVGAGTKEIVSSGVSGLYNKLRSSVGTGSWSQDGTPKPGSSALKETGKTGATQVSTPSASRDPSNLAVKETVAQSPSSFTTSAPSSPVVSSVASVRDVGESKTSLNRREGISAPGLEHEEATQQTDAAVSARDQAYLSSNNQISQELPPPSDIDRARSALVDGDRSASATQALARVLSHREVQIGERSQLPKASDAENDLNASTDDRESFSPSDRPVKPKLSLSRPANAGLAAGDADFVSPKQQRKSSRPSLVRVGVSHLPGFHPSKPSSPTGEQTLSSNSSQIHGRGPTLEPSPNINRALQRRRTGLKRQPSRASPAAGLPTHLKRRVISKEFWMKDENAKVCFDCGQSFSAFRRKHHCRTCGQIFDAKCTSLVSGRPFGQPGTLRLCRPCEDIIFGSNNDDSSVFTDEGDDAQRSPEFRRSFMDDDEYPPPLDGTSRGSPRLDEVATLSIGIPASRRNREAKRRSAVIEFDAQPSLVRPTSSRSLVSMSGRPRSSSHKRHLSRHQAMRGSKTLDEGAPFSQDANSDPGKKSSLPAFHNDNIIDPDLAPFLSDEGSDDDDQPNIFSVIDGLPHAASPGERERVGFGALFTSALKKGRSKLGDRSGAPSTTRGTREDDGPGMATKHLPKLSRRRNPSISSMNLARPSPRRSRSSRLLRTMETEDHEDTRASSIPTPNPQSAEVLRSTAMRGSRTTPLELNCASLEHVRKLLSQLLSDAKIEQAQAWRKALVPILLRCTDDVDPDVPRGDDMDIRHYIKLKKVPGGRPGDTSYLSGVVFSKNIALKSMARSLHRPRIAIVTFAIEYARHQSHFMSLEPVIAQEREYLDNLVGRIAALRPQLLLVQRNVSGLALRLLDEAGITVAYNIKESVTAAVARVTQTTMIKSVDKLTIDPHHLGRCEGFDVKTYVHQGTRKTYIVLSGCQPDLGCTIVLRGADTKMLRTIKRITEFMCYVVYNLKLETYLMRDEFVSIPSNRHNQLSTQDAARDSEFVAQRLSDDMDGKHVNYAQMLQDVGSRILSASPFVVFMQPYLLTQLLETEHKLAGFKFLRDMYAGVDVEGDSNEDPSSRETFELVKPEMVHATLSKDQPKAVRDYLHAVHSAQYDRTMATFDTQRKLWQAFLANEASPFDPLSHQTIMLLHSTVSSITSAPCIGPDLLGIGFYAGFNRAEPSFEEDCTLGQYVEDICLSAGSICKECDRKMYDHHRQYVHGYGQVSISVQRQPARMRGLSNTILMWSSCRQCRAETNVVLMSDNTWKYSFAKYLELSFWSSPLRPRAGVCEHDIHKDFLRCFGFQNLVVRVQHDPIAIYDIVVPRPTVSWKVEGDLVMKNEQYQLFEARLTAFIDSIKKRLGTINVDTLDEKQMHEAQETLEALRQRADDDRQELLNKLQGKYATSRYYELIPLNRALRFMDEKALQWDETFNNFERDFFPSENDIRKLAAAQLKEMFYGSHSSSESVVNDVSDSEGGAELALVPTKSIGQRVSDGELPTEKTNDVLTSVAQEHRASQAELTEKLTEGEDEWAVSRHPSPRKEQEAKVSRDEVRHLDLAVPSISPEPVTPEETARPGEQPRPPSAQEDIDSPVEGPFATQPKPLSSGLLQRIEQIRSGRAAGQEDMEPLESKIPRPNLSSRRDENPTQHLPAPLLRAQSQPAHVPRRGTDLSFDANGRTPSPQPNLESPPLERRLGDRLSQLGSNIGKLPPSLIPRSIPAKSDHGPISTVSALARHFEHLSREFEKERLRERRQRAAKSRQARANPLASSRPVVEVYKNATEAVGEKAFDGTNMHSSTTAKHFQNVPASTSDGTLADSEHPPSQPSEHHLPDREIVTADTEADTDASDVETKLTHGRSRDVSDPTSDLPNYGFISPNVQDLELPPELSIPDSKRNVWFKVLAEFWSKRSASGWANLEYPLHNTEHVFEDSDIIVREDEPSSVIALSLASGDYINKVKEFRSHPNKLSKHAQADSQARNQAASEDAQQKAIEASLLSDTGTHMKYSFSHGPVKASCKIFYAESFDALRRRCGVSNRFVESLSRCMKFDSKGGKTKSLFLKTLDNRFIIKSLQEIEVKAFTKFAPDYFAFMSYTLFHGVPSVIAKMFGLFQVIIKNPLSGMDFSYYLLVMENLFYDHAPNRRFDLKGSMRNRKVESTGQPDEVLLDENLVETIFESPLFVREHSRKLIQASVWNDTLWLCKQNVMDYSLMAGFDDSAKDLVVGIIDCIRTYTWDKKLESWIKDRGKNKPTITSPKDYRNRFRVSMMQYMLVAPSPWHQFQASMALPKALKEKEEFVAPEDTEPQSMRRERGGRVER